MRSGGDEFTRRSVGPGWRSPCAAAANPASLKMANALGAWLGGVVVAAGYHAAAVIGAALKVVGLVFLVASLNWHRRQLARSPTAD